ncbi:hypothetical protein ACIQNI_01410 [Streptomyces sp. NPDC091266]|uniref:hypothetical protein n=1 Tax=Streptomyces sp. NPDC091266 TaxID=3365978 RepID=UPI00381C557F
MATADQPGGGNYLRNVRGAIAIGNQNTVTNYEAAAPPAADPAQAELLRAVRALRGDLTVVVENPETLALRTELADTETEIADTGAAGPGRLARLRTALTDAGAVVGLLASGAAVGQAVAALVGG